MGIIRAIIRSRRKTKAEIKAAKTRAKAEVKENARLALRSKKVMAAQERRLARLHARGEKAHDKHVRRMAKMTVKQTKAGRFNPRKARRMLGVARLLVPVLTPLVYRGITALQEKSRKDTLAQVNLPTR